MDAKFTMHLYARLSLRNFWAFGSDGVYKTARLFRTTLPQIPYLRQHSYLRAAVYDWPQINCNRIVRDTDFQQANHIFDQTGVGEIRPKQGAPW